MSKFIKLTDLIINKNFIHHIDLKKDKIIVHLMTNKTNGFFIFGMGSTSSHHTKFEICKINDPNDYNIFTDWIDNDLK
jgi:hypothetical protein